MYNSNKTVKTFRPIDRLEFLEKLNQDLSTRGWRVEDVSVLLEHDGEEATFVFLFQLHEPARPAVAVFHCWKEMEAVKEEEEREYENDDDRPEPQTVLTWKMWNGRFKWPSRWPDDEFGIWRAIKNFFKSFAGKRILRSWCLDLIWDVLTSESAEELDGLEETVVDG